MPTFTVPKGEVHYEVEGPEGAPWALVLPGAATAAWMYDPLRERLRGRFRVLSLEYRGIGKSRNDEWNVTPALLAEDALGLLDHLRIERIHAVGFSLGTFVLAEMLHRAPERLDRCGIGCMPAVRRKWHTPPEMAKAMPEGMDDLMTWNQVKLAVLPLFFSAWYKEAHPEKYRELLRLALDQPFKDLLAGMQQLTGVFGHDWRRFQVYDTLPRDRRLFLSGEMDFMARPEDLRDHPLTGKGPTVLFRRSGHVFFYEQPDAVAAVLRHFWRTGQAPAQVPVPAEQPAPVPLEALP